MSPRAVEPPWPALACFLAVVAIQRVFELWLSSRHASSLAARGGVRVREPRFPLFVALHTLFPIALIAETLWLGARPGNAWMFWLLLFMAAQALRVVAILTLGGRWNVRLWVVPGEKPIRHGLYRALRHPNYVAVAIELVAGPLIFGAWRTALLASLFNALLLRERIRIEERALAAAAAAERRPSPGGGEPPGIARTPPVSSRRDEAAARGE